MDRTKFTANSPGKLVRITQAGQEWAFVPEELPSSWEFDVSLWPLLAEAKEALGTLNGIGQTLPDPKLLQIPLQGREAIASSRIEGTYVTPEQLLLFQLDPREPTQPDEQALDRFEVFNYGQAMLHGCERLRELPICNRIVREMHGILLQGVRGRDKNPGEYRKWQVQIGASGRFMPPPSNEVDRLMANLERYINADDKRIDPLVRSFIVHYQFEAIHPFSDGNGRVGRSLLVLMVYKLHGHSMPWLYMSAFFERFRDEYIENLFKVSTEGAWSRWIEFCLRGVIAQARDSIRRCDQIHQLRRTFLESIPSPSSRTHRIIQGLFTSPVVQAASIAQKFEVTYPTAKADIDRLVEAGILREMPKVFPRTCFAPEIMKIAYGEPIDEEAD